MKNEKKMKKVVIIINDTTYAYNLRAAIIKMLIDKGYEVVVAAKIIEHSELLEQLGCKLIDIETRRHGKNPLKDIILFKTITKMLLKEKPSIVLTYNIKPNVYGGMACTKLKIPFFPNITGLGTPVEKRGLLQKLTIALYKKGVAGAKCVFFQNEFNRDFFIKNKIITDTAKYRILPGSGVDLDAHPVLLWTEGPVHFLYAARIMKEKGIDIFLDVAHKYASSNVLFDVCGQCDDPHYLDILKWDKSITYYGFQNDLTPFYKQCSCFLYPSYYPEGMSNVLLEAAASGRPIVAADRPGCKETVENGKTGYLVPVKDSNAVFSVVQEFINLTPEERKRMGLEGRKKMENEFDRKIVVQIYKEEIETIEN